MEGGPWALYAIPIAAVICAAGTWEFATPRPSRADPLELTLRAAGVATCALQLYATYSVAAAMGMIAATPSFTPRNPMPLCQAAAFVWGVTAVMTFVRAGLLAKWLGDTPGVMQACLLGVMSFLTLVVNALTWRPTPGGAWILIVASAVVTSIWSVIFFVGFCFVLRNRSRAQEVGVSTAARPG